jgi:hypothetical protein
MITLKLTIPELLVLDAKLNGTENLFSGGYLLMNQEALKGKIERELKKLLQEK